MFSIFTRHKGRKIPNKNKNCGDIYVDENNIVIEESRFYDYLVGKPLSLAMDIINHLNESATIELRGGFWSNVSIVEEIIRRNGEFLTGYEAAALSPCFDINPDLYYARWKRRTGDPQPKNPEKFGLYDWTVIDPIQYEYGQQIEKVLSKKSKYSRSWLIAHPRTVG